VSLAELHELIGDLDVDEDVKDDLRALTPATYTGVANDLADDLE
jgi:adenylosuccinate lyase